MPIYLQKEVSDAYLQALLAAYRKGQEDAGGNIEDGDDIILDRLSANEVMSPRAPSAYDLGKADSTS